MQNDKNQFTEFDDREGRSRQPNLEATGLALQDAVDIVRNFNTAAKNFEDNIPMQLLDVSLQLEGHVGPLNALRSNVIWINRHLERLDERFTALEMPIVVPQADSDSMNEPERQGEQPEGDDNNE